MAVRELNTKEEFDACIKDEKLVLVDYTAEWCGNCKKIAPLFVQLAKDFAKDVVVASVDVDENEETPMEQLEKLELPTIQLFHNGACVDTTRPRKDLEEYLRSKIGEYTTTAAATAERGSTSADVDARIDDGKQEEARADESDGDEAAEEDAEPKERHTVNPFIRFCASRREALLAANPDVGLAALMQLNGTAWQQLSDAERESWGAEPIADEPAGDAAAGASSKSKRDDSSSAPEADGDATSDDEAIASKRAKIE